MNQRLFVTGPVVLKTDGLVRRQFRDVWFIDIDGTVRKGFDELGKFVKEAADVQVYPEAVTQIRQAKAKGIRLVGVSSQWQIDESQEALDKQVAAMYETDRQCHMSFDFILFCPHIETGFDCHCQKPSVGLMQEGLRQLQAMYPDDVYSLKRICVIGDRSVDAKMAELAGVRYVFAKHWRQYGVVKHENER